MEGLNTGIDCLPVKELLCLGVEIDSRGLRMEENGLLQQPRQEFLMDGTK